MKTRQGFVSNSSSSSFVIISNFGNLISPKLPSQLVVDGSHGETEFGWKFENYYDFWSKLNWAYMQASYMSSPKKETWTDMIEEVIKRNTDVETIDWRITTSYPPEEGKVDGYIDHQSCCYEGENTEIFDSINKLTNFLFNPNSHIEDGNDNC